MELLLLWFSIKIQRFVTTTESLFSTFQATPLIFWLHLLQGLDYYFRQTVYFHKRYLWENHQIRECGKTFCCTNQRMCDDILLYKSGIVGKHFAVQIRECGITFCCRNQGMWDIIFLLKSGNVGYLAVQIRQCGMTCYCTSKLSLMKNALYGI
jgi:hypothetical protein